MNSFFTSLADSTDNTFIGCARDDKKNNVKPVEKNWVDMGGFSDGWTDSPYFKKINYSELFNPPSDESIELAFIFSCY